jgi:uracil-DNA glycosylase family 4
VAASQQRPLAREPDPNCSICPRLAIFRDSLRAAQPEWHNAPVPAFGALDARLLVVGLAPGLRGANRTGRPFTGDFAGDLLYETLIEFGFATGGYGASIDDGLRLVSCAITNAVRCVPPQNKPTPSEIKSCCRFLAATIAALPDLCAIVALGRIAHESVVRAFGLKPAAFPFAHGAEHVLVAGETAGNRSQPGAETITLVDSYHCSRYNTNTGVLTQEMFRAVFAKVRERL